MKKLLLPWLCFFACLFAASVPLAAADTHVPFRADLPAGAAFRIDARQLRPTQFAVGRRAVLEKKEKIEGKSAAKLVAYLKNKDIPVVVGPGGAPYLTDGHHTLNGLLRSRHADKTAYGHVLANWSDLAPDAFWVRMAEQRYVYLKDETGRAREAAELPTSLLELRDDPWRSLAGAVLDAGGYGERPDVFYQQFLWADFFRERVRWNDRDDADFARALREASALAREPAAKDLPGYLAP